MRAEDIAFIINPTIWYQSMYPSGILALSGYLDSRGIPSVILDSKLSRTTLSMEKREAVVIDRIRQIKPKVVCLSSTHMEFGEVVRINQQVKAADKKIITIVGGAQPTYRSKDFLDNGFDFVCVGVGEVTLHEFALEVMSGEKRWAQVKGLAWRKGDEVIVNPRRSFVEGWENVSRAMPAYAKIDPRFFDMNIDVIRGVPVRGALLSTTRGCPFSCCYCGCNLIFGTKLHFKPLEVIEDEVRYLKSVRHIEGIWIIDDTFTINPSHVRGVCDIFKRHGLIWACQSRVDTINEEIIDIMKSSGCIQIDFGVESGSRRILQDIIGKGTTPEQAEIAFALAKKYNLRTFANLMVGLPTETFADLRETTELADRINADVYLFSIATPLPGTKLYEMVDSEISPSDYSQLSWNGSDLTERMNRSEIPDIKLIHAKLCQRYFMRSFLKSLVSFNGVIFVMTHKDKITRAWFLLKLFFTKATKGVRRRCGNIFHRASFKGIFCFLKKRVCCEGAHEKIR